MDWFFNYINKLQQLPQVDKKRKAILISALLTFIIFIFWLSTLSISSEINSENLTQEVNVDITPLKNIKSSIDDIADSVINLKNIFQKPQ